MPTFRCIKHEWQLPLIGRDELLKVSPALFASRFFALPANKRIERSGKDDRSLLTTAFICCLDKLLENGPLPRGLSRQGLIEQWSSKGYWHRRSSTNGTGPRVQTWNADVRAPAESPLLRELDPPSSCSSHTMEDYVMPPRSSLSREDFSLKSFYDRFCYANPEARRREPWDIILAAYKRYVFEHYGKDLHRVRAAYRVGYHWSIYYSNTNGLQNTFLSVPEHIVRKHCDELTVEIERRKTADRTDDVEQTQTNKPLVQTKEPHVPTKEHVVLKRPSDSYDEGAETSTKRIKVEVN